MNLPVIYRSPDEVLEEAKPTFDAFIDRARAEYASDALQARAAKKIAAGLAILNDQAQAAAGAQLQSVMRHIDSIEERRTRITKPLNDLLRRINAAFAPAKKEWGEVAEIASSAVLGYTQAREAAAQQAAMAAQHLATTTQILGSAPAAHAYQALAAHAAAPTPKVEGISSTEHWTWQLAGNNDEERAAAFAAVPREFLCLDEKKLTQYAQMMKGVGNIPGIRIFRADFATVRR